MSFRKILKKHVDEMVVLFSQPEWHSGVNKNLLEREAFRERLIVIKDSLHPLYV